MPTLRSSILWIGLGFASTASAQAPLKVFDPSYIDTSANACQDFFSFANGAWVKRDTIPAAFSSSGVSKDMTDRNELVVRSVLEDAMARRHSMPATSTVAKLGTYYASCMDSSRAEREGLTPIKPELDRIAAINTRAGVVSEITSLQKMGVNALFNFFPASDPKDAAHYIASATQGGLGMPDRDYYTKTDPATDSLRQKYVAHITKTLVLAGESEAAAQADARRVMSLETELAKASMTRLERRDPNKTYHKTSVADLSKIAPAINWPVYFRSSGITVPIQYVNVGQPEFMKRASALVTTLPIEDWRAYLKYHLLSSSSRWLSTRFVNEDFAYNSLYSGAKELLPRWKRCLRSADNQLGEALGEAYVAKTFSPEAKAQAKQIIDDIRA
ncbi:MAG TPA: M13 family metallopeptidase N-terminal domain-containing protein, partial [Gemmatimonadaceae bacterium]|nr:M13 family metallopeptidase N-terminal domain-containing protein [Gemmatimonadaceae bacterium]